MSEFWVVHITFSKKVKGNILWSHNEKPIFCLYGRCIFGGTRDKLIDQAVSTGFCKRNQIHPVSEDASFSFKWLSGLLTRSNWSSWSKFTCSRALNTLNMLDDIAISLEMDQITKEFRNNTELSRLCDDALIHKSVDWLEPENEGANLSSFDSKNIVSFIDNSLSKILEKMTVI